MADKKYYNTNEEILLNRSANFLEQIYNRLLGLAVVLPNPLPVSMSSDIEIGAIEIKNGTDDTRAEVTMSNALKVDGSAVTQPVSDAGGSLTIDYGTTGSGTSTGAIRVELPTNGTGVVGLNAGIAEIGNVKNSGIFAVQSTEVAPTIIYNNKKTVTTAGTRVALASSTTIKSVTIKALSTNTGIIYVGDSSVASTNGYQLLTGEITSMDIANLNTINIDSSISGEGVTYLAVN